MQVNIEGVDVVDLGSGWWVFSDSRGVWMRRLGGGRQREALTIDACEMSAGGSGPGLDTWPSVQPSHGRIN